MAQNGIAAATWLANTGERRATIALIMVISGAVSVASVLLSPVNAAIAAWWPAAGISVIAVLASRGTRVAAAAGIAAISLVGNVLSGRELLVAVLWALGSAIEAWVVARLLTGGKPEARLESPPDVSRLIAASAVGSAVLAVLAGAALATFGGQAFSQVALGVFASHLSAMLIIVPLGLVNRRTARRTSVVESIAQVAFLALVLIVIFAPGAVLPIVFVTMVPLLWAAIRLPIMVLAIELVVCAGAVSTLTALGGGPFAVFADDGTRATVELLQVFFIVHAVVSLYVVAAHNDWASAVNQVETREALLRAGIASAESGLLVAENLDSGRYRVVGVNAIALGAMGWGEHPDAWQSRMVSAVSDRSTFGDTAIDECVAARGRGRVEFDRDDRRFEVDVATFSEVGGRPVVTLTFRDVTESDQREKEALAIAAELRELNQQKDDFVASVSHELRTPVTSILGFSEQLIESELDRDAHQAARVIYRNARRLADVIEDVLELSSLTTIGGNTRLAVDFDAGQLLRECVDDATGLVTPGRGVQVVVRVPEHPVIIHGVEQEFTRVCANLLSNAIKFSPVVGTITVTLSDHPDEVTMTIVDEGPGIPVAEQEAVWERFYRVQSERHRDVPGTGLGLPIVRALVHQRLEGHVELLSDGEQGTTAVVSVPRRHDVPNIPASANERAADQAGAE